MKKVLQRLAGQKLCQREVGGRENTRGINTNNTRISLRRRKYVLYIPPDILLIFSQAQSCIHTHYYYYNCILLYEVNR